MTSIRRRRSVLLVPLLFVTLVGCTACRNGAETRAAVQAVKDDCATTVKGVQQSGEEKLANLQKRFDRYRALAESNPQAWFSAFDRAVAERPFLARLVVSWSAEFALKERLKEKEALVGGREVEERRDQRLSTLASAGFLLGRRSGFNFGLIMVRGDDFALQYPGDAFFTPPADAEVNVPGWFNRSAEYSLKAAGVRIDADVMAGCGTSPPVIVHAWRMKVGDTKESLIVLVVGCKSTGSDMPLFNYEGFERWTSFTEKEMTFPRMTPEGGISMALGYLDRKYGEFGQVLMGIGMPSSIELLFLPVAAGAQQPVIHSAIFQIDEKTQIWMPFWSVRKQLASAQKIFNLDAVLEVPVPLVPQGAYNPEQREAMLQSYQSLINVNDEYR